MFMPEAPESPVNPYSPTSEVDVPSIQGQTVKSLEYTGTPKPDNKVGKTPDTAPQKPTGGIVREAIGNITKLIRRGI